MNSTPPTIRPAHPSDIPALLSLLLTSFRQFPLFSHLYPHLLTNKDTAHDTILFWKQRLLLDLQDPFVSVLVAEIPETICLAIGHDIREGAMKSDDEAVIEEESRRMLDWVQTRGGLSQVSQEREGWLVVGFAIWRDRIPEAPPQADAGQQESRSREVVPRGGEGDTAINAEEWVDLKNYQRRDQDPERYAAYLKAEEELSQRFYATGCYYLDNLCVDFRHQRRGIGTCLVEQGLQHARGKGLAVQTEASPKGLGLYQKLGFKNIGTWRVPLVVGEEFMELPVLRWVST
ncbi:hypothetical protein JMJ35_010067 [Cladonia borealis]|uniref:N-acetyltransferase domain-containing protein n=1 Tax=Cladonia borealis TaxID=184061 RepID=A0AA39QTC6_9LECA|nr:hypothetical protein JMJ35_010067 [Cladonia borealis]